MNELAVCAIASFLFGAFAGSAFFFSLSNKQDGVWCAAGKHFFATWKPCPCCMGEKIDEYIATQANK